MKTARVPKPKKSNRLGLSSLRPLMNIKTPVKASRPTGRLM